LDEIPEPYDPMCERYARDMTSYDGTWAEDEDSYNATTEEERQAKRIKAVIREEGTYNPNNGHFLCDSCYIKAGMPTGPHGWTCP